MTLVADALGARRIPSACRTRQVPTVRRSCQPMPGATGVPLARSQTMLDARWFAMPTPATRAAVVEGRTGDRQDGVGHAGGIELHQAGGRRVGQEGDAVFVLDRGVGPHDGGAHARRADVDDQDAPPAPAHAQGAGPKGEARPNLPGLRMPLGSNVALSPWSTSNPEPSALGRKRERLSPMPWWWLIAAPCAIVASVTVSQAWR